MCRCYMHSVYNYIYIYIYIYTEQYTTVAISLINKEIRNDRKIKEIRETQTGRIVPLSLDI